MPAEVVIGGTTLQLARRSDVAVALRVAAWDYPDSVDSRQGSTGVSVRVLMDTCS